MPEVLKTRHAAILETASRALCRAVLEPEPADREALLLGTLDLLSDLERAGEAGARLHRLRADALFALGDYDAVSAALAAGVRANRGSARLHSHAASLLLAEMRRLEEGHPYLVRAQGLDPEGRIPRPSLAAAEAALARFRAAGLRDGTYRRFGSLLSEALRTGCAHGFAGTASASRALGLEPGAVVAFLSGAYGVRCDCDALRRARGL